MNVQLGVDVAALFIVCCFAASFALGALIAWLILQNHYHH